MKAIDLLKHSRFGQGDLMRRILVLILTSFVSCSVTAEEFDGSWTKLLTQRCGGGETWACTSLGNIYFLGEVGIPDYDKAAHFFEKGCEGGDTVACLNAGVLFHEGPGVAQDYKKAARFYQKGCSDLQSGLRRGRPHWLREPRRSVS